MVRLNNCQNFRIGYLKSPSFNRERFFRKKHKTKISRIWLTRAKYFDHPDENRIEMDSTKILLVQLSLCALQIQLFNKVVFANTLTLLPFINGLIYPSFVSALLD